MGIARIEQKLLIVSETVGVSSYDFNFELNFACDHPYRLDAEERCVLRVGPLDGYDAIFAEKLDMGLRLVNAPEDHLLASELERWYPLIQELTPRTVVYETLPDAAEIEAMFEWPVFLKGSRQTSKHNPELAIIKSRAHYEMAAEKYREDEILHWQKPVVREFVPLMPIAGHVPGKVPPSAEYRSFWWNGACVGWGRYWYQVAPYEIADVQIGLALAQEVASRLNVPFLVVDFAKALDGRWIVIECNDAQESGYAGVNPLLLWRNILEGEAR
ncbi:ATP-grasp domain-containing protein [Variovorax boronicumulans]|uniref:ATP-grasp domain-containing protein n=1 Tax=Variovorax boronicumulans TaxID=436515 RepID=UPI003397FDCC